MPHLPLDADPDYSDPMVTGLGNPLKDKRRGSCAEKPLTKENAPAATEAGFETRRNRNYKRLPPYSKGLMALRQADKVPVRTVMVCFDWKLARAHPRVVIPADAVPAQFEFKFLAGLPVHIIYRGKDAHRVDALVQEIMQVNPCLLATFALDLIDTGDVLTIIKPHQRTEVMGATAP